LFRVARETFEPLSRKDSSEWVKRRDYDYYRFLLQDIKPLEEVLPIFLRLRAPGLSSRSEHFRENPLEYHSEAPAEHDLIRMVPPENVEIRKEIYIYRNADGSLSSIFECRPADFGAVPGCSISTRLSGIDVRISFTRANLPKWKEIYTDVSDFIGCIVMRDD